MSGDMKDEMGTGMGDSCHQPAPLSAMTWPSWPWAP